MDESSRRPRQVDGDGAAKRRRLRRLRSWWRHEQQTMAAVLATYQHHSAPRGPRKARTGEGARDELHGYAPEDAPPQAAGAQHFALDAGEDDGEAPAAGRPAPLLEVLPQERVQQCTAEQIVDPVPLVPLLHDACAANGGTVGGLSRTSRFPCSRAGYRSAQDRVSTPALLAQSSDVPQTAEQLVEALTIVSYSSLLQRTIEQPVDIPVPRWWRATRRSSRFSSLDSFPQLVCGAER